VTERRRLAALVSDISDRERARMGADLHDGLGQELAGLALLLRGLAKRAQREGPSLVSEIMVLSRMASNSAAAVHDVAQGMLPLDLRHVDFKRAIQALARSSRHVFRIHITVRFDGDKSHCLRGQVAEQLYRVAQEAITNAVRHGRAERITLGVYSRGSKIALTVTDNGVGFEKGRSSRGMGLHIMKYRARILGGLLEVKPGRSHGTRVLCIVPVTTVLTAGSPVIRFCSSNTVGRQSYSQDVSDLELVPLRPYL
jgi:signal transduction histidine kinase